MRIDATFLGARNNDDPGVATSAGYPNRTNAVYAFAADPAGAAGDLQLGFRNVGYAAGHACAIDLTTKTLHTRWKAAGGRGDLVITAPAPDNTSVSFSQCWDGAPDYGMTFDGTRAAGDPLRGDAGALRLHRRAAGHHRGAVAAGSVTRLEVITGGRIDLTGPSTGASGAPPACSRSSTAATPPWCWAAAATCSATATPPRTPRRRSSWRRCARSRSSRAPRRPPPGCSASPPTTASTCAAPGAPPGPPSWPPSPATGGSGASSRTLRELVRALLAVAPAEAQEIAVLYFVDELTQAEIAEATGRSLPTIRKRLREFLGAARAALAEAFPDLPLPDPEVLP